jgi:hypothetical protein
MVHSRHYANYVIKAYAVVHKNLDAVEAQKTGASNRANVALSLDSLQVDLRYSWLR